MRFMTGSREAMTWTLKSERPEAAGYLTVRCRTYLQPDGKESDWDILQGSPTVALVAFTEEGRGILVRQYRPGPGKVLAELPGGMIEPGEDVLRAAARELLEETGYRAGTAEVVLKTYLASYATHERYAVVARDCRKVAEPTPDAEEFVEPFTLARDAYVDHLLSGEYTDTDVGLAGLVAAGLLVRKA
ncbi:NUDIX hydrolase [[Kitasatospora] papulosa]|nr:ADP-ribose pyrophosphatase [Streptomyces pratensis]RAS32203.1 ADP-ribose pyrophosphatase [Streptomyces avidinii]SNX75956.1 ADP-ribose pyrophosphatase [Streptomyces microflavus]